MDSFDVQAASFRQARRLGYLLFAPALVLPGILLTIQYVWKVQGWHLPDNFWSMAAVPCSVAGTLWIAAVMRRIALLAGIRSGFFRTTGVFVAFAGANLAIGAFIVLLAILPFGPH